MNAKKAIIMARVSTPGQAEEGLSLEAQEKRSVEYAKRKNLEVQSIHSFNESSVKDKRKKFEAVVKEIKQSKEPIALIVEAVDRLQRDFKETVEMDKLIKKEKVELHFIRENLVIHKDSPANAILFWDMQVMVAKNTILRMKGYAKSSHKFKVEKGEYPGFPPIGYEPKHMKGSIEIDPYRAPLIKQLFELARTGKYSVLQLTDKMRILGLKSRDTKKTKGIYLHKSQIHHYLHTHFYYGCFKWGEDKNGKDLIWSNRGIKNDLEPTYEPLISKELYDEVQYALSRKYVQRKRGKDFKFKGLITCHICGCSVVGETKTKTAKNGKKKSYTYYHCTQGRGKCALPWATEKEIESAFVQAIEYLHINPQTDEFIREQLTKDYENRKELVKAELQSLRSEYTKNKNQIEQMYQDKLDGIITDDFFTDVYDKKIERQEVLREEINNLEEGNEQYIDEGMKILDLAKDFKTRYLSSKGDERKEINQLVFRTITMVGEVTDVFAWCMPGCDPLHFVYNEPFNTLFELKFEDVKHRIDSVLPYEFSRKSKKWLLG